MNRRAVTLGLLLVAGVLGLWTPGAAYTPIRDATLEWRWNLGSTTRPNIASGELLYRIHKAGTNNHGEPGFGPIDEFAAVKRGFDVWEAVASSAIKFRYDGTTTAVADGSDDVNSVYFDALNLAPGVFGTTTTTLVGGEITDADLALNDKNFTWGTLGPNQSGTVGRAMVENIVAHEAGHVAGLDHSFVRGASMFSATSTGKIDNLSLGPDDIAAISRAYPGPGFPASFATLAGTVTTSGGTVPAFAVQVAALEVSSGEVVLGALTQADGTYAIEGVPPGRRFALVVTAVNPSDLGPFYAPATTNVLGALRGVALDGTGVPSSVALAPGGSALGLDADLAASGSGTDVSDIASTFTARPIAPGEAAFSVIESRTPPATDLDYFQFAGTAGHAITIRAIAAGFGSGLDPRLTLLRADGTTKVVSPDFADPEFQQSADDRDPDGFDLSGEDRDAELTATLPASETYYVRVDDSVRGTVGGYVLWLFDETSDQTVDAATSRITVADPGLTVGQTTSITVAANNTDGAPVTTGGFSVSIMVGARGPFAAVDNADGTYTANLVPAAPAPVAETVSATIDGVPLLNPAALYTAGAVSGAQSTASVFPDRLFADGASQAAITVTPRDAAGVLIYDPALAVVASVPSATVGVAVFDPASGQYVLPVTAGTLTGVKAISASIGAVGVSSGATLRFLAPVTPVAGGAGGDGATSGGGCGIAWNGKSGGLGNGLLVLAVFLVLLAYTRRR